MFKRMTEMSPLGTVSRLTSKRSDLSPQEQWDAKAKQGCPLAGVELRIVDEGGKELPWDGETMGELQVRGPWVNFLLYVAPFYSSPFEFTSRIYNFTFDVNGNVIKNDGRAAS